MLEVAFSCPLCSRLFLKDCPYPGGIPPHLDPLLGTPCPGSGRPLASFLEIPDHPHPPQDWPRWDADEGRPAKAPRRAAEEQPPSSPPQAAAKGRRA